MAVSARRCPTESPVNVPRGSRSSDRFPSFSCCTEVNKIVDESPTLLLISVRALNRGSGTRRAASGRLLGRAAGHSRAVSGSRSRRPADRQPSSHKGRDLATRKGEQDLGSSQGSSGTAGRDRESHCQCSRARRCRRAAAVPHHGREGSSTSPPDRPAPLLCHRVRAEACVHVHVSRRTCGVPSHQPEADLGMAG